jgi:hypothetical protein
VSFILSEMRSFSAASFSFTRKTYFFGEVATYM